MKTFKLLIILSLLSFTSCIDDWDKYLDTKQLDFSIIKASNDFKDNSKIHVEQYKNDLTIRLNLKRLIKSDKNDSLENISIFKNINFEFYDVNNNKIVIDPSFINNFIDFTNVKDSILNYSTECNLLKKQEVKFSLPLIFFYNLKNGENKILLKIYADKYAKIVSSKNNYSESKLKLENNFWGIIEININIPKIYKTVLCNDSIILENDKDFSPVGMDFSFRDGLPDIYWNLYLYLNNGYTEYYHSGHEANYNVMYTYKDTASLYYINKPEKIEIQVMDRDVLSPDDIIGTWKGSFNDLLSKNNNYKVLKFKHIDRFKIKVINQDILLN